jgi:hypothetical protein
LAIFFGSLLGLVVAFGVWKTNSALRAKQEKHTDNARAESDDGVDEVALNIVKPTDMSVSGSTPIKLTGISETSDYIVVSSEDEDDIIIPQGDGGFEDEVSLTGGLNEIKVFAFGELESASQSISVVYSTQIETKTAGTPQASDSSNVGAETEERVNEAANPARTFFGTVTDIAGSALQLRTSSGEIKQVSVADDTSYANIVKNTTEIEFGDIAIGDYVIVLGYRSNENEVFEAKRILVSIPFVPKNRQAIKGGIAEINKSGFTLQSEEKYNVTTPLKYTLKKFSDGKLIKAKSSDISEGSEVIVVGTLDGTAMEARSVFILTNSIN